MHSVRSPVDVEVHEGDFDEMEHSLRAKLCWVLNKRAMAVRRATTQSLALRSDRVHV